MRSKNSSGVFQHETAGVDSPHRRARGCSLLREGAKHSVYISQVARMVTTVPMRNETDDNLARKICKDLGVEKTG